MKNLAKHREKFMAMKIGEQLIIPWSDLPGPRPFASARFGVGVRAWRADPKHEGLLITREPDLKADMGLH